MKETKTVALSAALVLLVWAGVAQAEPRAFPLEPQFVQKDLVVAGKVIKVDEPVQRTLGLLGQEKDATDLMRKFQVEVAEVFKDMVMGAGAKRPAGGPLWTGRTEQTAAARVCN